MYQYTIGTYSINLISYKYGGIMYLDTTILQSRTTTTLIEYIDELTGFIGLEELPEDLFLKYENIKKQHRIACKKRGQRIDDDKSQMLEYSETGI